MGKSSATKKALEAEKKALDALKASGAGEAKPYTGTWVLDAKKTDSSISLQGIRSFELVEGIWFMYHDDGLITAVPISNWDFVQIEQTGDE
jgi:hypothetical protein